MSQCERNIDCLECSIRGMCNSYAMFEYKQGIADAINSVLELKNRYENFTHEEYYVSAMVSDLEVLIYELQEKNNARQFNQ